MRASVTNVASASNGTVTSPTDTETVTAVQTKSLSIVKTATPSTYNAVGNVISYSYLVTNNGNVTLSGPFTVSDDKATDEACPATPTSLAPGDSITCTASYTITPGRPECRHSHERRASASERHGDLADRHRDGDGGADEVAVDREDGDAEHLQAVGNVINYSYLVTNNGNVTLSGPFTVSDDKSTDEACPATPTSLAPGESVTCTASYTITPGRPGCGHSHERGIRLQRHGDLADRYRDGDGGADEVAVDREDGDAEHLQRGGQRHQLQLPGDQQRQRDVERAVHGE